MSINNKPKHSTCRGRLCGGVTTAGPGTWGGGPPNQLRTMRPPNCTVIGSLPHTTYVHQQQSQTLNLPGPAVWWCDHSEKRHMGWGAAQSAEDDAAPQLHSKWQPAPYNICTSTTNQTLNLPGPAVWWCDHSGPRHMGWGAAQSAADEAPPLLHSTRQP